MEHGGEIRPAPNEEGRGTGLGLSTIRQRLSLHYSERATMDVKSSAEQGTVVNLVIPLDGHEVTQALALPQGQGVS